MELFKLQTDFHPGPTVTFNETTELAWVERYQSAGEFQLVVKDDITIRTQLPTGTLISHTDTSEVMIIEDHHVQRDKDKILTVTITGRSFETFAEQRITQASKQPINDSVDNALGEVYGPATSAGIVEHLLLYAFQTDIADSGEDVPNLYIAQDMRTTDALLTYAIKRGELYSVLQELLKLNDVGIKNVRPAYTANGLRMYVHDGADLSGSVVFYAQYEDLDDAQYFESIKAYKTHAWVAGKYWARPIKSRRVITTPTGLTKRLMYVEDQNLDGDYSTPSTGDVLDTRGQQELDQHPYINLMSATISQTAIPKFKIDYDVGDLVTVFGEFDVAQRMRVAEHALTLDKDGLRGFPSLIIA